MEPMILRAQTAADLMTPGPVSLSASATVAQAAAFLTERGFGAAVVIDEAGHPLGVVTKTDVLVHTRQRSKTVEPDNTPVTDIMTPAVISVRPDTSVRSVVEKLLNLHVHHLFVVDATGVVIGVISPIDVLKKLE
ncbi:MAG: CBS domain-containing protein [Thermogemmata sp.]|uniref:CBS domain-containing protein n=1 Tax=Thermogemmata fonticola TaxID=2755323 RepID=A0A7V8VFE4_9BACT|nr:CBS domain-containing protein [Thermogemmata fonticola]MBA2226937.1 CBS domain-containing protein [Thermogemmata fonticola]MCX8139303.1 CBS domain-containing protein [Gemmataceae bacterium]